eukprot:jgi/Picre1/30584/NNA_005946.t1
MTQAGPDTSPAGLDRKDLDKTQHTPVSVTKSRLGKILSKELSGLQEGRFDTVSRDIDVWIEINEILESGVPIRSSSQASQLSQGAVRLIRQLFLAPLLHGDENPIPGDSVKLIESMSLFACLAATCSDAMAMRNTVKELLHIAEDYIRMAHLYHWSHTKEYYCQSFVQNLQNMAAQTADIMAQKAVDEKLSVWMHVLDDNISSPVLHLISMLIDHIGTIIACSWHHHLLQAQQDVYFLEIVSGEKFIILMVALRVLQKLRGDEDFSRLVIPLLTDMMALQAEQLDVGNHVFAANTLASIGRKIPGNSPGALATALKRLASGMKGSPLSFKKYLRKALLTLFSDFALLMPNDTYITDLGSLLPAIAAGISTLNKIQEESRLETSAFRHLWFCCAVYDFASIRSRNSFWPQEWSDALCQIASRTPILLIGSEQQQESAFIDHIGAEFGGWLGTLGKNGEPKSLLEYLKITLGNKPDTSGQIKPELCCHVLTIAYIAFCHAQLKEFSCSDRSPMDAMIVHAQFSLSTSMEYAWYKVTIKEVFSRYLRRLIELKSSSEAVHEVFAVDSATYAASIMIESLVQQGPNDDIPKLMLNLLQLILPQFPSLYFSAETINGAIRAVAAEQERLGAMGGTAGPVPLAVDPRKSRNSLTASKYLLELIESAASRAPGVIEAAVGENLRHMSNVGGTSANVTSTITPSVMEALQRGRSRCTLPDSMGIFKGVIAWSSKIRALGVIDGLRLNGVLGQKVIQRQTADLVEKLRREDPYNSISDSILDLTAACIAISDDSTAKVPLQLLAWAPLESANESRFNLESSMLRIAESISGGIDTTNLSNAPYSCSTRFRLLNLILEFLLSSHGIRGLKPGVNSPVASRYTDVVNAGLAWFISPVAWIETSQQEAHESYMAMKEFGDLVTDMENCIKKYGAKIVEKDTIALLTFLIQVEVNRLRLWANPLDKVDKQGNVAPKMGWELLIKTAWNESPKLALSLGARFSGVPTVQKTLQEHVIEHAQDSGIQKLPEAVNYLATAPSTSKKDTSIEFMNNWEPMGLEQAMSLMSMPIARQPAAFAYIIRCLELCDPTDVSFFLPQLVQLLRHDPDKGIENFLMKAASRSSYFAFLLKCQLLSEGTPPDEAFTPEVKRSNWAPPSDTGLWRIADETRQTLMSSLKGEIKDHLDAESDFFDKVTDVSGKLYPVPKDERKAAAVEFLSEIAIKRDDLFMPFDPNTILKGIKPETAAPMQSAAKCPILVAFDVEKRGDESSEASVEAAIFKVGDDCRQDVLALQVVELMKRKFDEIGLLLPLVPYGVIPTGHECGIIQVVPKAKSRAQLGEITDGGLLDVFQHEFGLPGSARFEAARTRFIQSSAAYAIVSYILQAKDRHNGNIMVDNTGKMIHIDFGYIFGISPGGNMGFESAAFKLSYEMTELLDPGNTRNSIHFMTFQELCVKGYLAARTMADSIVATVAMMLPSKLPCFSRGDPIESLRERFHLEMTDQQAAEFMKSLINDAYDKWTTGVYDLIQYYQNRIPK